MWYERTIERLLVLEAVIEIVRVVIGIRRVGEGVEGKKIGGTRKA